MITIYQAAYRWRSSAYRPALQGPPLKYNESRRDEHGNFALLCDFVTRFCREGEPECWLLPAALMHAAAVWRARFAPCIELGWGVVVAVALHPENNLKALENMRAL